MNTISYEGVVFTRGAIRLHRAADKSLRRFVLLRNGSFAQRTLNDGPATRGASTLRRQGGSIRNPVNFRMRLYTPGAFGNGFCSSYHVVLKQ